MKVNKSKYAIAGAALLMLCQFSFADENPLTKLIGTWEGDMGVDVSPSQRGSGSPAGAVATTPYYEKIVISSGAGATNASVQDLVTVRYHQMVFKKADNQQFHDQVGYLIWDKKNNKVYNSFCIPRAVCAVAEGDLKDANEFTMSSKANNLAESSFMIKNAKTKAFTITIKYNEDGTLSYTQKTDLLIYGKPFSHVDSSVLTKK
ncbi:heme-binding beta-barrel domain-containing protein [Iodobacter ciconiae]|uniref:DUF1794 domain-containing protein n=1 Tax=Iodobacter ciconiae TaxID=2496266 RepID=A0A3S8ZN94_9NEIS|nr:heme-binding beta-barrel domain-containing protein [Iodobacter ciconiae]AZN35047.1 DUF1794 domain-containing protein [Iodobacter ciconiae]